MSKNSNANGSGNGSGNGHDPDKIVSFPSLAERDRIRKRQQDEENAWRAAYKARRQTAAAPFLNISKIPLFTRIIVLTLLTVHTVSALFMDAGDRLALLYNFGFIPQDFATGTFSQTTLFTPFTHIFIHSDWVHLIFNTIMALALSTFFEREFGTRRAIIFFFACGLAGAMLHFAFNPFSPAPVIGASGAISGLFGAIILRIYQRGSLGPMNKRGPWPMIGFWLIFMLATGLAFGGLAWLAHIGGFIAGVALLHFKWIYKFSP